MFKSMRNKMLLVSMALFGLVIIVAFAALYGFTYFNTQREITDKFREAQSKPLSDFESQYDYSVFLAENEKTKPLFRETRGLILDFKDVVAGSDFTSYFSLTIIGDELVDVAGHLFEEHGFYHLVFEELWEREKQASDYDLKTMDFRLGSLQKQANNDDLRVLDFAQRTWLYVKTTSDGFYGLEFYSDDKGRVSTYFYTEEAYDNARKALSENGVQFESAFLPPHTRIVFMDITRYETQLDQLLFRLVLIGFVALVFIFFISLIVSNHAIKPIEESWLRQKQFVADASHELKTPITVISANVEAIEASGDEAVSSQKEWFSHIHAELARMSKLVGDMLFLAKTEDAQVEFLPFDLALVCESVVASTEAMLCEKSIRFEKTIEKYVAVKGNKDSIEQAIKILMDNAAKYTNQGGSVTFTLQKARGQAVICVKNTGEGIPAKDLPKIFDRFYRPDVSRAEDSGGYGLGLAIAKSIVETAKGEITAQSDEKFTTFTISFKLAQTREGAA